MKKNPKMIIIGGGPAGLGAAYRLRDLGYRNWVLYEKNNYFGGQSATHVDENGFLWDEGGHVLHSHYKYFDKFIDKVLGKDYFEHQRESWIRLSDVWVPYPFQNNIRHLKKEDQLKCIFGLLEVNRGDIKSKNFKDVGFVEATVFAKKVSNNTFYDRVRNYYIFFLKSLYETGAGLYYHWYLPDFAVKVGKKLLRFQ